jgi:phospholipid/cholesterol/gamma-HCH transport system substrate-binding protein
MSTTSRNAEILTGLAVIAGAIAFLVFALRTAGVGVTSSTGYTLSADFDNIEGVNVGTDVRLAGIKVGSITKQALDPQSYQARVDMRIDPSISLSDDTTAKVASEGLLGAKFVALEPGGSEVKLSDGGIITYTQGAVDIWSLISQAMFDRAKPANDASKPNGSNSDSTAGETQAQ